jgi:hypothetical protein
MTELEYFKELARLWEVSSFDFRAKTGNSFEDGPTHKAAVAYAARKNELVGIKITGSALDLQLKEALIENGGPWKNQEYKPGQEFVNATLGVPYNEQLDLEPNAAVDALNAIAELCGVKEWDYPGQVVRDVKLMKESKLPYPENRGSTHWEGCFRDRKHHNCAVLRINDLNAEGIMGRRVNAALRKQIHEIWEDSEPQAEIERLRNALWALGDAPWTDDAPGLATYVRDLITSGHTQLDRDQQEELSLLLYGESDEHSVSTPVAGRLATDEEDKES